MATDGTGKPSCSQTGLSVPECSCRNCLEAMLREIQPTLLAEEIRVVRLGSAPDGPAEYREAA